MVGGFHFQYCFCLSCCCLWLLTLLLAWLLLISCIFTETLPTNILTNQRMHDALAKNSKHGLGTTVTAMTSRSHSMTTNWQQQQRHQKNEQHQNYYQQEEKQCFLCSHDHYCRRWFWHCCCCYGCFVLLPLFSVLLFLLLHVCTWVDKTLRIIEFSTDLRHVKKSLKRSFFFQFWGKLIL